MIVQEINFIAGTVPPSAVRFFEMQADAKKTKLTSVEKQEALRLGVYQEYTKACRLKFKGDGTLLDEFRAKYDAHLERVCQSIKCSKSSKKRRIEERFYVIALAGECLFLTLTFTDVVLSSTSEETRRTYVARFLKEQGVVYCANIDFGDKAKNPNSNEREHYHALIMPKGDKIDPKAWHKYGLIKIERVHPSPDDNSKVSQYVAKLSNHALKESARIPRLVWSRGYKDYFKTEEAQRRLFMC